jgi:hypothetical protein
MRPTEHTTTGPDLIELLMGVVLLGGGFFASAMGWVS